MFKTTRSVRTLDNSLTISTESLTKLLDCGRATAIKIGDAAGARIQIGRRVLWNSEKIRQYINSPHLHLT